jgi:hypothetical protein
MKRHAVLGVVAHHGGRLRHLIAVPGEGVALCGFAPVEGGPHRGWISAALARRLRALRVCGPCYERHGGRSP